MGKVSAPPRSFGFSNDARTLKYKVFDHFPAIKVALQMLNVVEISLKGGVLSTLGIIA